jgi:hypothetical protein
MSRSLPLVLLVACAPTQVRPLPPPPPPPERPTAPVALDARWAAFEPLLGDWDATGNDPTGPSIGHFSLAPELGGKILVRHSVNESKTGKHDDLMIIYDAARAIYFDNEGHTINYAVTASPDRLVFLSDEQAGAPRFRLTYMVAGNDGTVQFDIAPPGSPDFRPYVGGTFKRAAR